MANNDESMAIMTSPAINDKECPLCGQGNSCAVSNGASGEHCWCQNQSIDNTLLEKIPGPLKNKSCICQACAEKADQLARELP
jgi:hypothetical protein